MTIRIGHVNLFTPDPERLCRFYADVLGFPEIEVARSPIFRALDGGGIQFGFNAVAAYELLNLSDRQKSDGGVNCYFTIEVSDAETVAALAEKAAALGGQIIKPPYDSYYNARQCVLADPENNVFRVSHQRPGRAPYNGELEGMNVAL